MPTQRQRKVAKLIIENTTLDKPKTGGQIVESSGYGVSMKKNPQVILESEGVKQALEDYGFNEDNAKKVVSEIMLNSKEKAETRLKATDQVFKVHNSYKERDTNILVNQNIYNTKVNNMSLEEVDLFLKAKLNESTQK